MAFLPAGSGSRGCRDSPPLGSARRTARSGREVRPARNSSGLRQTEKVVVSAISENCPVATAWASVIDGPAGRAYKGQACLWVARPARPGRSGSAAAAPSIDSVARRETGEGSGHGRLVLWRAGRARRLVFRLAVLAGVEFRFSRPACEDPAKRPDECSGAGHGQRLDDNEGRAEREPRRWLPAPHPHHGQRERLVAACAMAPLACHSRMMGAENMVCVQRAGECAAEPWEKAKAAQDQRWRRGGPAAQPQCAGSRREGRRNCPDPFRRTEPGTLFVVELWCRP